MCYSISILKEDISMIKDMIKDMKFPSWQGEVQNGKFVPKKGINKNDTYRKSN